VCIYIYVYIYIHIYIYTQDTSRGYMVATINRLLKIIDLFCNRAL